MSASPHPRLARLHLTGGHRADPDVAQYRYGMVLLLVICVVVFVIVVPDNDATRAIAFALVGAALVVAIGTSRERSIVRRRRVLGSGTTILVITVLTAAGAIPVSITFAIGAAITLAVPAGLAIYLLLGLAFASLIGFLSDVQSGQYFAQAAHPTTSDRVYYSFTVLTTTGFGDFTAAHSGGRALAVLEMLVGQIYLVTVISILIGRRLEQSRS
jgi:hypothetical protein